MTVLTDSIKETDVKNRIRICLLVYAEANNISEDDARAKFIVHMNGIAINMLTFWENNTSQPKKYAWPHVAAFFGKKIEDIFFIPEN